MSTWHNLRQNNGQRMRWTARVGRRGKTSRGGKTLLLLDVRRYDDGQPMTEHLWIPIGKWNSLLKRGQHIAFDARIDSYIKGHGKHRITDYHLEYPTKVCVQDQNGQWQPAPRPPAASRPKPRPPAVPTISDPATPEQIFRLASLRGFPADMTPNQTMSRKQASREITALAAIRKQCAGTTRARKPCVNVIRGLNEYCPSHRPKNQPRINSGTARND